MQAIKLGKDMLLRFVRNTVQEAYKTKGMPTYAYVQVLNLFYLCDQKLIDAVRKHKGIPYLAIDLAEDERSFGWLWYVWGDDDTYLNSLKNRFDGKTKNDLFFGRTATPRKYSAILSKFPALTELAHHTQGLATNDVIAALKKVV